MNAKFIAALAGLALAVLPTGAALAYTAPTKLALKEIMQTAAITPLAMQYFCAQNKNECAPDSRSQVTMTPNFMALLEQVNVRVNRSIRPRADTVDVWELNPASGDCEDYVLSKRSALIRQGVSAGALRVAYTHTRSGEPHAVLVVRTGSGDYVLDNLNNTVKTLQASGYTIRSMSSPNPRRWVAG